MIKVFIILGARVPQHEEWQAVALSSVPDELKRALRIQWKTFVSLLEDEDLPGQKASLVEFLERCLRASGTQAH